MSISDILPTAVQGLQRQASRVEQSAERIARFSTGLPDPYSAEQAPAGTAPGGQPANVSPALIAAQETGGPPPATDDGLVLDLVTLRQASIAYKANIAVFETGDEMAQEIIDLAKPKD